MTTAVPLPVVPSHTVPPLVVLEHALLVLTLEVNPTTVVVGDTASITVTIRNTTGRTATDVVVTLPAPAESVPVPAPAYQPAQRHWQWTLPHLAAFESHSMTAQVRVVRLPDGAALVATAAAIGANSPRQTVTGGALVAARPPDGRGATARFVPGQQAVLDRSNERINVTMSGGAARQPLSLRARTVLERRLEPPALGHMPALNHGRHGIATYFLDATTDADTAVHDFAAPVTITLALTKRTKWIYDQAWQGGMQYGNLTKTEEYDGTGALYRSTESLYDPLVTNPPLVSDGSYVVDRKRNEAIRSGDGKLVAATQYFYDGNTSQVGVGPRGLLTLTRKFSNITPSYVYGTTTLDSVDTSYQYDPYGNQTHVTTYAAQGYRAGTSTWSAPGNGSVATTTETTYDGIFHAYSEKVTSPPAVVGAAPLIELAGYDLRMGTLTSVTGPNGTATTVSAEYDVFGRLWKIIKPGDTSALPTVEAVYDDYALPFRYIVAQRGSRWGGGGGGSGRNLMD